LTDCGVDHGKACEFFGDGLEYVPAIFDREAGNFEVVFNFLDVLVLTGVLDVVVEGCFDG
jgi:hypothetical protein